jgi:hypothetical protein
MATLGQPAASNLASPFDCAVGFPPAGCFVADFIVGALEEWQLTRSATVATKAARAPNDLLGIITYYRTFDARFSSSAAEGPVTR